MDEKSFNRVVVNSSALENNFRCIQGLAGDHVPVMAMVKADGYGHGMVAAARSFGRGGCRRFGVAELSEGVLLRKSGIKGEIYVTIGFCYGDVDLFFTYDLIPVVYSYEAAAALSVQAMRLGRTIGVHVKVDTGMGRLGVLVWELGPFLARISELDGITVAGIMSHFPESDDPHSTSSVVALEKFAALCDEASASYGTVCHIANSGAVLNFPDARYDMVRAGIALYGYHPAGPGGDEPQGQWGLQPAMSFYTRVLQVKELPTGTGISYGHTYVTRRPTRIAVLPVGYEDGYSRALSNLGKVLVKGQFAPVRGRICMNMCMVEVSHIDGLEAGDEVVLMGRQQGNSISADDIAAGMNSISYEVLCKIGSNNFREYQAG